MSALEDSVREQHVHMINGVVATNTTLFGVPDEFGLVIVRNLEHALEFVQMGVSNKTQTIRLHTSQLESLKEVIEMKLEMMGRDE